MHSGRVGLGGLVRASTTRLGLVVLGWFDGVRFAGFGRRFVGGGERVVFFGVLAGCGLPFGHDFGGRSE
jgi:hypothetical protein